MSSTPSAAHPFRRMARVDCARPGWFTNGKRKHYRHSGEWRCTHLLVYEDQTIGRLYFWRGAYYTAEQYQNGEPGYTRRDLREGESIESAYDSREESDE